ncbi:hypothetical protein [Caulobacter sp.]|uniref:hypothetical protein n=1 Tax=Caulobacter sp. TaxID=78 RepID=UPI002B483EF8|nr:hypothetical protein [Caulobacter sp.]HJV41349.1 hypothetical protein [Caulobacter sp.]
MLKKTIISKAPDPAAEDDRAWFEANAERRFRLRDPAPLEFKDPLGDAGEGFSWRVLVARLPDGGRLRLPISLSWELHNDHAKDQHLKILFDQIAPPEAKARLG